MTPIAMRKGTRFRLETNIFSKCFDTFRCIILWPFYSLYMYVHKCKTLVLLLKHAWKCKSLEWRKSDYSSHYHKTQVLKVALQILGQKFYKNTRKSFLYSQSLLIFIHRTPLVERHPITREIRDLLLHRSTPTGNTVYFYMSSSFI